MKFLYFFCCVWLLSSCTNKSQHIVKKEYFANGNVKSIISYIHDSIKDGYALYYNDNNVLVKEEYFKKGENDSVIKEYYDNGHLKSLILFYYNIPINYYFYYQNGKLRTYQARFSTDNEGVFYLTRYDSLGNILNEDGRAVSHNIGTSDDVQDGRYNLNDSVHLFFYISKPPNYNNRAYLCTYRLENLTDTNKAFLTASKRVIEPFKQFPVLNSIVEYNNKFSTKGVYQVVCAAELLDVKTNYSKKDTTISILYVR